MKTFIVAGLAAVLVAPAAFAGHGYYDGRYDSRYQDSRYDPRYPDNRYPRDDVEYAQVVSARPLYRQVAVSEPRQECWDERVSYGGGRRANETGSTVMGAIGGGVAGHQFGQGHGRDAATVLGVLIGASIGNAIAHENNRYAEERVGYEQRCRTVEDRHYEDRVEGYDVTYRHHGRLYHTRTPYDPGSRIAVQVNVRPVSYPGSY
jgi:uncharacterized protein YcfJ